MLLTPRLEMLSHKLLQLPPEGLVPSPSTSSFSITFFGENAESEKGRKTSTNADERVSERAGRICFSVCVCVSSSHENDETAQSAKTHIHKSVCDWKKETSTFVIEIWFKWWKGDSIFMQYISAVFETKFMFIQIVNAHQWSRCFLPHSLAV